MRNFFSKLKKGFNDLEGLWMNDLYVERREYNKAHLLNRFDDDWRRL